MMTTSVLTWSEQLQFNREMIHIVRRISKMAPSSMSADLKLSNPDLPGNLRTLHSSSDNAEMKSHIERFFVLANENLSENEDKDTRPGRVYRGSSVDDNDERFGSSKDDTPAQKKKLTYRGREFEV